MRPLHHILLGSLLLSSSYLTVANSAGSTDNTDTETLTQYLQNLGAYLGFDITQSVSSPLATLLSISDTTSAQQFSLITRLGAIPVNAYSTDLSNFVPGSITGYALMNEMANYTFNTQSGSAAYNTASTSNSGGINVSTLIDQKTYQNDPVSQSILNMLTTPQITYCLNNDVNAFVDDCNLLYDAKVTTNVIGAIPAPQDFFSFNYNQDIMTQLNGNTLLGPLLYDTSANTNSTSSDTSTSSDAGLTANNQAQEASNFILYATNAVIPPSLPKYTEYKNLYSTAATEVDSSDASAVFEQKIAQDKLARYFGKLRNYTAQHSIPTSNFYSMLSKRMPQVQSGGQPSSQALSEFQMATRRLFTPSQTQNSNSSNNKQWIEQINSASDATVLKEMVVLLAEMNYQLYLLRQEDERMLATLSVLVLQNMREPEFSSEASIDLTSGSSSSASDDG